MATPVSFPKCGTILMRLAFPDGKGRWHAVAAEADVVDGAYHKLKFPGFETRSGQGFGITATFHLFDTLVPDEGRFYAKIRNVVVQNGEAISSEVVGEREEILIDGTISSVGFE